MSVLKFLNDHRGKICVGLYFVIGKVAQLVK